MTELKTKDKIDWQPLNSTKAKVDEQQENNDITKEIHEALVETIQSEMPVLIDYVRRDTVTSIKGIINKYDPLESIVVINNQEIKVSAIVSISKRN